MISLEEEILISREDKIINNQLILHHIRCNLTSEPTVYRMWTNMDIISYVKCCTYMPIYEHIYIPLLKKIKRNKTFEFKGNHFSYFISDYNITVINERTIEIPIITHYLKRYSSDDVLEVGNVLSHYFDVNHTIVDKYEQEINVINQDICTYNPGRKFQFIATISTVEHIGYDEIPRHPENLIQGIENIKKLLSPGGEAWITVPAGYNPFFKDYIKNGKLIFDELYGMKRISRLNNWIECSPEEALQCPYGPPHATNATGVVIGVIKN